MTVVIGAKEYPENIIEGLTQKHDVSSIDGQKIAIELGNSKVLNSVVLGFASKAIGFDKDEWLKIIENTVPQKTIEINKKAFECGYNA
jgi:indolepyruvate ferredoxin oxidoreductase beta subunit